jgi:hypothetical protein
MPSAAYCKFRWEASPSAVRGTDNAQKYGVPGEISIAGDGESIVQLSLALDDYAGGGTDPEFTIELEDGSGDDIAFIGTGFTGKVLAQQMNGEANDFSFIRSLAVRGLATDAGDPSKLRALLFMGNLAGTNEHRLAIPLLWDSTDSGRTAECGVCLPMPRGFDWDVTYPLKLHIYESLNVSLIIGLQGD